MIHLLDLHFLQHEHTIAAFLLETEAGLVLLETGPYSTFPKLKKELDKLGFQPKDVEHVFLSHIHLDHAGAAWAFAETGATIYVHPFGAPHLSHPERLMESARRIYKDQMDTLWGAMRPIPKEQIRQPKHGEKMVFGTTTITAWYTPGHATHHIAYQLNIAGQSNCQIIAGDVAGVRINEGIVMPPCPPPDIHIEDWQHSIGLVRDLKPDAIYLTHFGKITDVEAHLDALEARLWDWANWMKPFFDAGTDQAVIIPQFQEYVAGQLAASGIGEEGIAQYESANPSWMSVAGLLRYWRKKEQ